MIVKAPAVSGITRLSIHLRIILFIISFRPFSPPYYRYVVFNSNYFVLICTLLCKLLFKTVFNGICILLIFII